MMGSHRCDQYATKVVKPEIGTLVFTPARISAEPKNICDNSSKISQCGNIIISIGLGPSAMIEWAEALCRES